MILLILAWIVHIILILQVLTFLVLMIGDFIFGLVGVSIFGAFATGWWLFAVKPLKTRWLKQRVQNEQRMRSMVSK